MTNNRLFKLLVWALLIFNISVAGAQDFGWYYTVRNSDGGASKSQLYSDPLDACLGAASQHNQATPNFSVVQPITIQLIYNSKYSINCLGALSSMPRGGFEYGTIYRDNLNCPSNQQYDPGNGQCEDLSLSLPRKQMGDDGDGLSCGVASSFVGNPVNASTGNKLQVEWDIPSSGEGRVLFGRVYNSMDGVWRNNYSVHLNVVTGYAYLVKADGSASIFTLVGLIYVPESTELGSLVKTSSGYNYTDKDGSSVSFDNNGGIVSMKSPNGFIQNFSAIPYGYHVSDQFGGALDFTQDARGQPLSLGFGALAASYQYALLDQGSILSSISFTKSGVTQTRSFLYEDSTHPTALTGLIDERGVRYATWHYDAQGRAISSEHANGAEKVTLTYNDDGSTTVTNALGHAVTYRYQVIQGIKHITSIEGEPAAGCPASNSSYTYNAIGQVATKTDALGHITAYTYDTLGRETQRVEAQGTPQARTTTTTWHGTSFLPETVTTTDRVTTYTYDTQNRLLSTSTHAAQGSVP